MSGGASPGGAIPARTGAEVTPPHGADSGASDAGGAPGVRSSDGCSSAASSSCISGSGGGSPDDSIPEGARPDGGSATASSAGGASAAGVRRRQNEGTWLSGALHLDFRQCWCMTSTFFRAFMSFSLGCCSNPLCKHSITPNHHQQRLAMMRSNAFDRRWWPLARLAQPMHVSGC